MVFDTVSKICSNNKIIVRTFRSTAAKLSNILEYSANAKLNKSILDKYLCLPVPECKVIIDYVWVDGTKQLLRSRTRTIDFVPGSYKEIPIWFSDGSITYQSTRKNSEIYLCPVAMYNDPFRRGNNKIVLCDTYRFDHKPARSNVRWSCMEAMNAASECEPLFGIDQQYIMIDADGRPFGWPAMKGEPVNKHIYYCGIGANTVVGREIAEAHYRACLYSGISHAGTNPGATKSQWNFRVGTSPGIKVADELWTARYILWKIAEEYGVDISLDPKLFKNWPGSGAYCYFSTKAMRAIGGLAEIEKAICKLSKKHDEHITLYDPNGGMDNIRRLTGKHQTSLIDQFSFGVADRNASIRIPRQVAEAKRGFFEDRRPASNCNPYSVIEAIVRTCVLDER